MLGASRELKVNQTENDLRRHLNEQIDFLIRSCQSYDGGLLSEAKRIAVTIRIIIHDTSSSISLLNQIGIKEMDYFDTSTNYNAQVLPWLGLIIHEVDLDQGAINYILPLDDGPPSRYIKGKIPFEKWWENIILVDKYGNTFSRKDLILSVCNKDGGAHIDPKLDKAYADLTRFGSAREKYFHGEEEKQIVTPAELATIRQIGHEVLKSFKDSYPEYFLNK